MDFLFLILFFCFFLFLYIVYELGRDDFIILRKNISMDKIFNAAFLVGIFALFTARLFYTLSHPGSLFLNPLVFLVFPYYPGLSLIGGILGGYLASIFILKSWSVPTGRVLDFFVASFSAVFPLGFLLSTLISGKKISILILLFLAIYLLFFGFVTKFILPKSLGGKIKEGTLSCVFLIMFSLIYIISNIFLGTKNIFNFENVISFFVFLSSSLFLVQYEGVEKLVFRK